MTVDSTRVRKLSIFLMGFQHVLVMYAGTIAVPLIVGSALKMSQSDLAYLINADLFTAGIVTMIQSLGLGIFGIRMPVMMGVTFATVGPMIAIGTTPGVGITGVYGAVIISGLFSILISPLMSRLIRLFPPVVTGSIICLIGLSLFKIAINWCGGGQPTITKQLAGETVKVVNPDFARLDYLLIAFLVLCVVLVISRFGSGIVKNLAVLIGLMVGSLVCAAQGQISLQGMSDLPWLAVTTPFHFGLPTFDVVAAATLCIVMIVVLAESMGMFLALGNILEQPVTQKDMTRGLRADGLATVLGGIFNAFPYTSYSQNVGLVSVTGVRRREVTAVGGLILCVLGLFPKLAHVVTAIPQYVLGGAGLVMFGMVAATGIRILATVDYKTHQHNLLIIAISLSSGMIPVLSPEFFQFFPAWTHPLTHNGIVIGSMVAVGLNFLFNEVKDLKSIMRISMRGKFKEISPHNSGSI